MCSPLDDMLEESPIAIPASLKDGGLSPPGSDSLYVVTIHTAGDSLRTISSSSNAGHPSSSSNSDQAISGMMGHTKSSSNNDGQALDGLQLGPRIACGSYGRVFRGHYHGAQVKIVLYFLS